ncbi:mechanosensitive ion channel family protein, partial [bacterium]|nr:mechanosensitive ion channel family protein [bacterium]
AGAAYLFFLTWNIDVTAWAASAGILGIAVGFAAKDTLANLFSGVFILVDAPYRIGDMILLDTGERGLVTEVGIRSTRIVTRDDVEITIPNSQIGAAKVTNECGGPSRKRRVDVRVGVSYASDPDRVRAALMAVAAEVDEVCEQPEPRVRFREMGDSALIFSLLFWIIDPGQRGAAVDAVNTGILRRFRAEGIEIPFPQRVVHFPTALSPPLTE